MKTTDSTLSIATELALEDAKASRFQPSSKQSFIQWPTEEEIQNISKQLARIKIVGIRSEADGEYFKSGELAYQIQEIIRATAELSKRASARKNSVPKD